MPTQQIDIVLAADYDVLIENGDFAITESTNQHQMQLLLNDKGSFKENPTICVGALEYLDDEAVNELARAVTIEFTRDGMRVDKIQIANTNIVTDAYYQ